jgi:hypothetical protein
MILRKDVGELASRYCDRFAVVFFWKKADSATESSMP